MSETDGLICAFHVNDDGHAKPLDWDDLEQACKDGGWTWLHFDQTADRPREWLRDTDGMSTDIIDAVFATETRPRCALTPDGTLLILRGVNLNPHADPEDMIAVRVWITDNRVITVRRRKLMAIDAIRQQYAQGQGPETPGDLIVELASGLIERMSPILTEFDEEIGILEEIQDSGDTRDIRSRLIEARQKMIPLRRYLAPQRDALSQLIVINVSWLNDWQRSRLREITDRVTRFVEDLDSSRERTAVIQDSVTNRIAERANQVMLVLSIVAAIFLPLGLLTGLLGINVGGMPGAEDGTAFWWVTGLLVVLGVAELAWFKYLKWI